LTRGKINVLLETHCENEKNAQIQRGCDQKRVFQNRVHPEEAKARQESIGTRKENTLSKGDPGTDGGWARGRKTREGTALLLKNSTRRERRRP